MRPTVRRSAPVLNSMIARRRTRRVLVEPGVSSMPKRPPLQKEQYRQEFEQREEQQKRQQLAQGRLGGPALEPVVPPSPMLRHGGEEGQHRDHHQHRPVKPDIVVSVGLVGGDGDDLAVALRFRCRDCRADRRWSSAVKFSTSPSPRSAAAAERSAAAGEAAEAAPAPAASPSAASAPQPPPREPRLSASRPQRMTATSPLSSPPRRRPAAIAPAAGARGRSSR